MPNPPRHKKRSHTMDLSFLLDPPEPANEPDPVPDSPAEIPPPPVW
jgi:hypothetical protein